MSGTLRHTARRFIISLTTLCLALLVIGTAPSRVQAADPITIQLNDATASFPEGITFTLEASSQRSITKVELLYSVADDPTLNLLVPSFTPAKRIEIHHLLDLQVYYLPPGLDLTYQWRLVDDRGREVATEFRTLLWEDTRFDWQPLASADVTVYAYTGNEAFNRLILDAAQSAVDQLKTEYGLSNVTPIRIWVYNSRDDFNATKQANEKHWAVGTAYSDYHLILATIPEGSKNEIGRVIPHEISHQLLSQATKNPFNAPPLWLDEGLAVRAQTVGNEDDFNQVKDAAAKGQLYSVRALISEFPTTGPYHLAYAESHSIVNFVIEHFGLEKLQALIAVYREGVSHDEALMRTLSVDTAGLDQLWKASLNYQGDHPDGVGATAGHQSPASELGAAVLVAALVCALIAAVLRRPRARPHSRFIAMPPTWHRRAAAPSGRNRARLARVRTSRAGS